MAHRAYASAVRAVANIVRSVAVCACVAASGVLTAQTADPTATAPNPVTSAPPARSGSFTVLQGELVAAPGLSIPNGNLPWALDRAADGTAALVPIHHSSITEPANADGPDAVPIHTLVGAHARTVLRDTQPTLFVHTNDRTENTGDAGRGNPTGWALVPATADAGARKLPHVRFDQIAQGTACAAPLVCLKAESLPSGWLRLLPQTALAAGDYALVPVPRQSRPGVVVVYDFTVDPTAPLARDAVRAGATAAAKHTAR